MNESHFDHSGEVRGCFFKSSENPPTFFEPADQSLDDVSFAVFFSIAFNASRTWDFILFGGNYGDDSQVEETLVNPSSAIRFVARQGNWPGDPFVVSIKDCGVS